jgi:hypothetical protein
MVKECGAVGGMRIGRGNQTLRQNLLQYHIAQHESYITSPGIESRQFPYNSTKSVVFTLSSNFFA